jgi:exodeoxyribonuclease VII large subunit
VPVKVQGGGSAEQVAAAIRGSTRREAGRIRGRISIARAAAAWRPRRSTRRSRFRAAAEHHSVDFRRGSRDGYHADRFRRRQARADADRPEMAVPVRSELFVEVESRAADDGVLAARPESRRKLRAAARAPPGRRNCSVPRRGWIISAPPCPAA